MTYRAQGLGTRCYWGWSRGGGGNPVVVLPIPVVCDRITVYGTWGWGLSEENLLENS